MSSSASGLYEALLMVAISSSIKMYAEVSPVIILWIIIWAVYVEKKKCGDGGAHYL